MPTGFLWGKNKKTPISSPSFLLLEEPAGKRD